MFQDREDAAHQLAEKLSAYKGARDAVVVAIPRGGVVTGATLAEDLHLPLEVILTKKIGHPSQPEFAIGVVDLAHELIDRDVVERDHIPPEYIREQVVKIRKLLRARYAAYYGHRKPAPLLGKTAILVDDGVATGNTMLAAIRLARGERAKKVVVGVPVAPADTLESLNKTADEVACVLVPEEFFSIGQFYGDFDQVPDEEAIRLLRGGPARTERPGKDDSAFPLL